MPREQHPKERLGIAGRLASTFLESRLTVLFIIAALLLGLLAIHLTPREEEPQIIVPMVDVSVALPGATAREVESQVATPLERRLWGLPGVEYVYSTSQAGEALVTVRFRVNEPLEPSVLKIRQELSAHPEVLPTGALPPLVRVLTIDDVPFLTLILHGTQPPGVLRQLGEALAREVSEVPETAQVHVVGGARRRIAIEPDPERLRAAHMSLLELRHALLSSDASLSAGAVVESGVRTQVDVDGFVRTNAGVRRLVVAQRAGRPVYLEDVASVVDGPEDDPALVLWGTHGAPGLQPAVAVSVAKRPGANATALAEAVKAKVATLRGRLLPRDVELTVSRNYGETAGEKTSELIEHLLIATLSVVTLILVAMGWRSAVVVGIAIPVTLAMTLLLTYLLGYTLNRVTLFALIFSIGILVDDAIVVMENIHRHLHLPDRPKSLARVVVTAVNEVGNPTILATFAVIAAILPMAFVRGMMGPYMRPIPVGASLAMLFSLVVAFVVSPWAAFKLYQREATRAQGQHRPPPPRRPRHARLPADDAALALLVSGAVGLSRLGGDAFRRCAGPGGDGAGEGEDVALRQQVRVPSAAGHAGWHTATDGGGGRPATGAAAVGAARGAQRRGVFRRGRPLHLRRPGATQLPARGGGTGGPPGEPHPEGRTLAAESRHRHPPAALS